MDKNDYKFPVQVNGGILALMILFFLIGALLNEDIFVIINMFIVPLIFFVNIIFGIYYIVKKETTKGVLFLISSIVVSLIGFGVCGISFATISPLY